MSGGGGKKRTSRAQGWEEAGAEFYQERYPTTEVDLEVLQKDPSRLATLLPSKQSRAATTKRVRPTDTRTLRRRTSTRNRRESSARRASTTHDVQVAMMPDLSENLSNEQTTWEEIMQIKAMPVPMGQKKELKAKLQNATHLRLQGFEQLSWQRRKVWQQFKVRLKETYSKLELWRNSLKKIEGNFGTGVVAYFLFLKWLMFLNLAIFVLIFLFVVFPVILFDETSEAPAAPAPINHNTETANQSLSEFCSDLYFKQNMDSSIVLDLIQGTGSMERTILFYGKYASRIFFFDNGLYYNLPLAYTSVTIAYFVISLVAIIKAAARGFKERLVEGEGQFYHYCNLVFGGWDFCIHNEKSAKIKHKAIFNELKSCLEAERLEEERKNRSREEKTKLIIIRSIINIFVFAILLGTMTLIYFVFDYSVAHLNNENTDLYGFLLEFLPSICIVAINISIPPLFKYLVQFEKYSPAFVVRLNMLRTIFLRLLSLGVLVFKFYNLVSCENPGCPENCDNFEEEMCASKECKTPPCWETYVGQQIYKLLLIDFFIHFLMTFFVNLPRALLAKHFENKFTKFIGEQQFDLSVHVLDVVYSQTLCWLGSFFAPMLPAIATITCFLMFYIKKFSCLTNSTPSSTVYRASRSTSMFMIVLLVAHFLAVIPVAYSIAEIKPSLSCGPYRDLRTVWTYVIETFEKFPDWLQTIIFGIGTAWFSIPMFIFLTLCLYYYSAVSAANKHMVSVLKNQLVLEGHDKQFLLNRLSDFIKQQQEYQKRIRNAEMMREHERVTASN